VDFLRRYYNDKLGLLWALIKPVFEAFLYYVAFKYLLAVKTPDFGLFIFGGIITWMVFSEGTSRSVTILNDKKYLIDNIQFNRADLYISFIISVFFGFFFNLGAFFIICLILGQSISVNLLYLPLVLISIYLIAIGVSFVLSTLQPFVKDITHIWDMVILTGFWLSGIFFDPEIILGKAEWFGFVNPFIGIIMNIRGMFIDSFDINMFWMLYGLGYSVVVCLIGYIIFRKYSGLALEKL